MLAALVAVFPGLNFVLLDSDCLPVTLFEIGDLWTEAYLARYPAHAKVGIPAQHPLQACPRFRSDPQVEYTQHRASSTRMGQGVLVVTEPHSEINAGVIAVFRSSHPPNLTGMPGHSAVGVSQGHFLMGSMVNRPRSLPRPFGVD